MDRRRLRTGYLSQNSYDLQLRNTERQDLEDYYYSKSHPDATERYNDYLRTGKELNPGDTNSRSAYLDTSKDKNYGFTDWIKDTWSEFFQDMNKAQADDFAGQYQRAQEHLDLIDGAKQHINNQQIFSALRSYFQKRNKGLDTSKELSILQKMYPNVDLSSQNAENFLKSQYTQKAEEITKSDSKKAYDDLVGMTSSGSMGVINDWMRKIGISMHDNSQKEFNGVTGAMQDWFGDRVTDAGVLLSGMENVSNGEKLKMLDAYSKQLKDVQKYSKAAQDANEKEQAWYENAHKVSDYYKRRIEKSQKDMQNGGSMWTWDNLLFANTQQMGFSSSSWDKLGASMLLQIGAGVLTGGASTAASATAAAARIGVGSALGLTGAASQISAGKSENNAEVVENLKTKIVKNLQKNPELYKQVIKEGHNRFAGKTDDEIIELIAKGDYLPEKSKALHNVADTIRKTLADSRAGVNVLFEKDQYAVTSDALFDTALYMGMPLKGLGSAIGKFANTSAKLAPIKKFGKWIVERGGRNVERAFQTGLGTGAGIPGGVVAAGLLVSKNVTQDVARLGIEHATKGGLIRNAAAWAEKEVAAGEKWFLKQKSKLHAKDLLKDNIIQNRLNRYVKTPAKLAGKIVASGYSEAIEEGKQYENGQEWINNENPKRSISFMEGIMEDASRGTSLIIPALGIPFGAQWGISGKGELYSNMAGGWLGGAMHTAMVSGGIDAVGMLTTPHSISISNLVAQNAELGRNIALSRYTKGIDLARTVEKDPNTVQREIARFKGFNDDRKKLGLSYVDESSIEDESRYASQLSQNLNSEIVKEQLDHAGIEEKSEDWYKAVSALTLYQNMGRENLRDMINEDTKINKKIEEIEKDVQDKQQEIDEDEILASTVFASKEDKDAINNGPHNKLINQFLTEHKQRAKTVAKNIQDRTQKELENLEKAENGDKRAEKAFEKMQDSDAEKALEASVANEKHVLEQELTYGDIFRVVSEIKGLQELKDDIDVADDYSEKRSHHDRRFFDAELQRKIDKLFEKSGLDKRKLLEVLDHPEKFIDDMEAFLELKRMYQNRMSSHIGMTVSNILKNLITGKKKNLRQTPAGKFIHDGWHLSKAKDVISKLDKSVESSDELVDKINKEYERESMGLDAELTEGTAEEAPSVTPGVSPASTPSEEVAPPEGSVSSEEVDEARAETDSELELALSRLKERFYEDDLVDLEIDVDNMLDAEMDSIGYAIMNSAFIDGNIKWEDAVEHAYNTLVKFGFNQKQINKTIPFFKQWYMATSVNPLYLDTDGFSSRREILSNPALNIIQKLNFDYDAWIEQKKAQLGIELIFDSEEDAFVALSNISFKEGDRFGIVDNRDIMLYTVTKTKNYTNDETGDTISLAEDIDDEFGNPVFRNGKMLTPDQIESFKRGYNVAQKTISDKVLNKLDQLSRSVVGQPTSHDFFIKESDGKIYLYKRVSEVTGDQYQEEPTKVEARRNAYSEIIALLRAKKYDELKNVSVSYLEKYTNRSKPEEYNINRTLGNHKDLQRYIDFIKQWDNPSDERIQECAEGLTAILVEQEVSPSLYMANFLEALVGKFFNTDKSTIDTIDYDKCTVTVYGKEVAVKSFIPKTVYEQFVGDLSRIKKTYEQTLKYKIVSSDKTIFTTLTDENGKQHRVADTFKYIGIDENGKAHIIDISSSAHTFVENLANGARGPHYNNAPLFGKYGAKRTFIEQRSMRLSAYVQMLHNVDNNILFAEYPIETIPIRIKLDWNQVMLNVIDPSDTEHPGVTQLFAYRNGEPHRIVLSYTHSIYGENQFVEDDIEDIDRRLSDLISKIYDLQEDYYDLMDDVSRLELMCSHDDALLMKALVIKNRLLKLIEELEGFTSESTEQIQSIDALNTVQKRYYDLKKQLNDTRSDISQVYKDLNDTLEVDTTVNDEINAENQIKHDIEQLYQRYRAYSSIIDEKAQRREYALLLLECEKIMSLIDDFKQTYPNNKNDFLNAKQLYVSIKNLTTSRTSQPIRYVRRDGTNYRLYNTVDKSYQERAIDMNGNKDVDGNPIRLRDVCGEPEFAEESITEVVRMPFTSRVDKAMMIPIEISYKGYKFSVLLRIADGKHGQDLLFKINNLLARKRAGLKVVLTGMDRMLGYVKDASQPIDVTLSMVVPQGTSYSDINMFDTLTEGNRKFGFYLSAHEDPSNSSTPVVLRDAGKQVVYTFPKVSHNGQVVDGGRAGKVYVMMTPDYKNTSLSPDPVIIPIQNQKLTLYEINFILNILKTKNLEDKVLVQLKDGSYVRLDCTYKDLVSMYIPYGTWVKKRPATRIAVSGDIVTFTYGINDQQQPKQILFDMSATEDDVQGLPALVRYMSEMFVHIDRNVIYDDTVGSNHPVFKAVLKFFTENKSEDSLSFGNTRLDFQRDNFIQNGHKLSGLAWMMLNQMMMTDAEKLVNPRFSYNDVLLEGEQTSVEPEPVVDDADVIYDDDFDPNMYADSSHIVTNGEEVVDPKVVISELKRIFGEQFEAEVVDNFVRMILDFPAGLAGRAFRDFIYISTYATPGTEYHEAFHRVYRLYLSEKMRKSLDKGIKKSYARTRGKAEAEAADKQSLEEFAADKCLMYFLAANKIEPFLKKPFDFIRQHYNLIKRVGSFRLYMLYMRMNNGKFRDKLILEENDKMMRDVRIIGDKRELNIGDYEKAPNMFKPHGVELKHVFGKDQYDKIIRAIFYYTVVCQDINQDMSNIENIDVSKEALEKVHPVSHTIRWSLDGITVIGKDGKKHVKYSIKHEKARAKAKGYTFNKKEGDIAYEYELDENGNKIKGKNGKYKTKPAEYTHDISIMDMMIGSCMTRNSEGKSVPFENGIAALKEIFEHWDVLQKDLITYMKDLNINYKTQEDYDYEQNLLSGQTELSDEEEKWLNVLLKDSHESAHTTRASSSVKRIFSMIKRYQKNPSGREVAVRNECGFHEFMDYKEVLNQVFADCLRIKTPSEMMAMFRKKANQGDNMYRQIYELVYPRYRQKDRNADQEQFITQLFNLVACTQNHFKVLLARRQKDGSYVHTIKNCGEEHEARELRKTWNRLFVHFGQRLFRINDEGQYSWYDDLSIEKLGNIYDSLNEIKKYFNRTNIENIQKGYEDVLPLKLYIRHLGIDHTINITDEHSLNVLKRDICLMFANLGIQLSVDEFDFLLKEDFGQFDTTQQRLVEFFNRSGEEDIQKLWNNSVIKKEDDKWVSNVSQFGRVTMYGKSVPVENMYLKNAFIGYLADRKYKYIHKNEDLSVLVTNNKRYYTVSENNLITDVTDELAKGGLIAQDLSKYCFNVFTDEQGQHNGSLLLKKLLEVGEDGQLDLNVCTLSQFKSDETKNEGHDYFDISEVEDYLSKTMILRDGYIIFPTMSDKKTWVYITGVTLPGLSYDYEYVEEEDKQSVKKLKVKQDFDAAYDQLIEYAKCEYQSVKQAIAQVHALRGKPEQRVKNFHENWVSSDEYDTLDDVFAALDESKYISQTDAERIHDYFEEAAGDTSVLVGYNRVKISRDKKGKFTIKVNVPNSCIFGSFNGIYDEDLNYINFNTVFDKDGKFHSPEMNLKLAEEKFFSLPSTDRFDAEGNVTKVGQRSIIERIIDQQLDAELEHMVELGLISEEDGMYSNNGLDGETIDTLAETTKYGSGLDGAKTDMAQSEAIELFAKDIVLKSIMSINEVERVYSGNPAFFKYKYGKDEDGNTVLVDRSSDEFKRLGGLISTGVNNNIEIKGMPEDGMYNCAIIDDVEVSSVQRNLIDILMAEAEWRSVYRQLVFPKRQPLKFPQEYTKQLIEEAKEQYERIYNKQCDKLDKELNELSLDQVKKYVEDYDKRNGTHYYSIIEKKVDAETKSYHKKINVADGAAYISPEMTEWLLRMCGSYDKKVEKAFKILKDPKSDIYSQAKAYKLVTTKVIGALKYTAYGQRMHETGDTMVPYYNKMALFPIFKCIATGEFSRIYERMLNNTDKDGKAAPVHMLMMDSAVKIGAQGVVDYVSNMNDENFRFNTFKQSFKYLRKQFNTDPHHQEDQNMGTQMVKVALASLIANHTYENHRGEQVQGRELLDQIMDDINTLSNKGYNDIIEEFFNEDGTLNVIKFSDYLNKNLTERDSDKSLRESIAWVRDGNGGFTMNHPLAATSRVAWLQSILVSHINKEVIDVKTKGSAFYQRSVFGMEGATVITNEGLENVLNGGKDLEYIIGYDDEGNAKTREDGTEDPAKGAMDCVLSIDYFADILEKAGLSNASFEEQKKCLINNGIIGPNAKASLVGYRIPTQAQSSIHPLRCVDVLPVIQHTIILPKEFTKVTGSDFDIDKIFIASLDYDANILTSVTADRADSVILTEKDDPANNLINNYITILKDHTSAHIAHRSIDNDTTLITDILEELEGKGGKKAYKVYDFYALRTQTSTKNEFLTGKTGIGPFALNNNSQILTMLYGVEFDEKSVMGRLNHKSLHEMSDDYGRSVMSWISALINAHVDIAKDSYITRLNVNPMTYNLTNLLIRTGYGDTTFHFLTQPVMMEMAKEYAQSKSEFMKKPGKSVYQIRKECKRNAAIKICGEENVKWAEDLLLNEYGNFIVEYQKGVPGPIKDGAWTANSILTLNNEDLINCAKDAMRHEHNMEDKTFTVTDPEGNDIQVTYQQYQALVYVIDKVLEKPANKLAEVVKYSKIDTKKQGISITEQLAYARGVEKTFGDHTLMKEIYGEYRKEEDENQLENETDFNENLQKMYWGTFIGNKTHKAIRLFARILKDQVIEASPAFQRAVTRIALLLGQDGNDKAIKKISTALSDKLKSKYFVKYADDHNIDIHKLFTGNNTIYDRLLRIQSAIDANEAGFEHLRAIDGQSNNLLIKLLLSDYTTVYDEDNNPNRTEDKITNLKFVRLFNALDVTEDKTNGIIQAWENLLEDSNEEVRTFARDLCVYAFFSSGDSRGRTKMFNFVPNKFREGLEPGDESYVQYIRNLLTNLKDAAWCDMNLTADLIDDVVLNNYDDYTFVKTIDINDDSEDAIKWDKITPSFGTQKKLIEKLTKELQQAAEEGRYIPTPRAANYPIALSTQDFADKEDLPLYISVRDEEQGYDDGFHRGVHLYKRVAIQQIDKTEKIRAIYIKVQPRGYSMQGGYHLYEYGIHDRLQDYEWTKNLEWFSQFNPNEPIKGFDGDITEVVRAIQNWRGGNVLERRVQRGDVAITGERTYAPILNLLSKTYGYVKYYGPTMGKTTAAKTNKNLVDFDDIAREPIKKLAEQLNMTVKELKIQSPPLYTQLLLRLIRDWSTDSKNEGKTLVVSNTALAKYTEIYDNTPMIPSKKEFIRRQVERSEDPNAVVSDLEIEAEAYYDDLINKWMPEGYKIEDRYVSELESSVFGPETKIDIYSSNNNGYDALTNPAFRTFSLDNFVSMVCFHKDFFGRDYLNPIFERIGNIITRSNIVGHNVLNRITVPSVENLFQALKVLYADDSYFEKVDDNDEFRLSKEGKRIFLLILTENPFDAKRDGGKRGIIKGLYTDTWNADKQTILKAIMKYSFYAQPKAKDLLLSTGNATLTHEKGDKEYREVFPRLLMEVRSEIREEESGITNKNKSNEVSLPSKQKYKILTDLINTLGGGTIAQEEIADTLGVVKRGTALDHALVGVDKVFTDEEVSQIKEALNGEPLRVMSVDRGTDIAFFADEFIEFLKQNAELSFTNKNRVNMIELWSKHDGEPMQRILRACKQYKVACATSFSITGLGDTALERGVMKHDDLIDRIEQLIQNGDLNPVTTTIRIDPILVGYTSLDTIEHIVDRCKKLGIKKFVTSLVQSYDYTKHYDEYSDKNKRYYNRHVTDGINDALSKNGEEAYDWDKYYGRITNDEYNAYWNFHRKYESEHASELEKLKDNYKTGNPSQDEKKWKAAVNMTIKKAAEKQGIKYVPSARNIGDINHMPKQEHIDKIGLFLTRLNQDPTIDIETCAFSVPGMPASACLDPLVIERLTGVSVTNPDGTYNRDTSRPDCMCYGCHGSFFKIHKDCQSSCAYCYAAHSRDAWYQYYDEYGNLIDNEMTRLDKKAGHEESKEDHTQDTIFGPDGLTDEQRNAKNVVLDFIDRVRKSRKGNDIAALVQGKAGTGKTFTAIEIIKELKKKHPYMQVCVATTSRKAAHVLGDKAKNYGAKIETIYTLSGANHGASEIEFDVNEDKSKWNKFGVIFIDECSMISNSQWKHIEKAIQKNPNTAFIFLGDKGQISGVDENNTGSEQNPIFDHPNITKAFLNTRIRQGEESPILPFADEFWKIAVGESVRKLGDIIKSFVSKITNKGSLLLVNASSILENSIPEFEKALADLNPNHIKIIAAKNETRAHYNKEIHNALFPDNPDEICAGDLIIFNSRYGNIIDNAEEFVVKAYDKNKLILVDFTIDNNRFVVDLTCDVLQVEQETGNGSSKTVYVPLLKDQASQRLFNDIVEQLRQLAIRRGGLYWKDYYEMRDTFGNVDWAYAITSHKSQGSTYDIAVVDYVDIYSGTKWTEQERSRMLYTAITRAKYTSVMLAPQGIADIGVDRYDNDMTTVDTWPIQRSDQFTETLLREQYELTKLENGKTYDTHQMRDYCKSLVDKKLHKLVDMVFDAADQLDIKYLIDDNLKARGYTPRYSRTCLINSKKMGNTTILHETIHQVVNYWLVSPEDKIPDNIKESILILKNVREELIYQYCRKNISGFESMTISKKSDVIKSLINKWSTYYDEETYGLSSINEFVAELCNGKILAMIDELDSNEEVKKSILKRIIDSILNILHFTSAKILSKNYTIKQNTAKALKELLTTVDKNLYTNSLIYWRDINNVVEFFKKNLPQQVLIIDPKAVKILNDNMLNHKNVNVPISKLLYSSVGSVVRIIDGLNDTTVHAIVEKIITNPDGSKKASLKFMHTEDFANNLTINNGEIKVIDFQPESKIEKIDNIDPKDVFEQLKQDGEEYLKMC